MTDPFIPCVYPIHVGDICGKPSTAKFEGEWLCQKHLNERKSERLQNWLNDLLPQGESDD